MMDDDYRADSSTTGMLAVGGSSTGNFETQDDADWFKLTLDAGKTYLLTFSGLYSGGGDFQDMQNMWLELYDGDGKFLDSAWGGNSLGGMHSTPPVALQFVPATSGTYYLAPDYFAGGWGGVSYGKYTVAAAIQAPDDLPSDTSTTAVLPAGGDAQANFEVAGDRDWFRFHAEAGQHYSFSSTTDADAAPGFDCYVYDASGKEVPDRVNVFEPGVTGDYFVAAAGHDAGHYTIHSVILDDDYSANKTAPGMLAIGGQISGGLQYQYDIDRFKVSLRQGEIYRFNLSAPDQDASKLTMVFEDGDGHRLTASGQRDADGTLHQSITAPSTGDFYIEVRAGADYYRPIASVPHYTLSSDAAQQDDYGDTPAAATALAIGGQLHGNLQSPADVDVVAVTLQAGTTYGFALQSDSGAQHAWPTLDVDDAGGVKLADAEYGKEGYFTYTPAASGTYYLATHSSQQDVTEGAYTLTTSLAPDDVGASAASAGRLAMGATVNGALEAGGGDRDWYAVALNAGTTYVMTLSKLTQPDGSGSYGSGALLKLLDASGNMQASLQGDGNDVKPLLFTPTAAGTYYLEVSSPRGATGGYGLTVAQGAHDDYGNDAAHATALTPGVTVSGRLENRGDQDVFALHTVAGQDYVLHVVRPADQQDTGWGYDVSVSVASAQDPWPSFRMAQPPGQKEIYGVLHATVTGDYDVTVAGGTLDLPHGYQITATAVGADDYAANNATTGLLGENGTLQGTIGTRLDQDWVKVHLEAGKSYTFDLHGTVTAGGTLDTSSTYTTLALAGADGLRLRGQSAHYSEPHVELTAATTGDYYLQIDGGGYNTGSYTVSAATVSPSMPAQHGGAGMDVLRSTGTGQRIDGAGGLDTVVYAGSHNGYQITAAPGQTLVQQSGAGFADVLVGVERLAFDDVCVALDVDGAAGQAYRLYQAAFNRAPKPEGLGFWMDALDHGVALDQVAREFIGSAEFQHLYGNGLSDTQFVNQLFHNVLHRDGRAAGIAFWTGALHDGVAREHVLAQFSESPENQAALVHIIGQGMVYTPHA